MAPTKRTAIEIGDIAPTVSKRKKLPRAPKKSKTKKSKFVLEQFSGDNEDQVYTLYSFVTVVCKNEDLAPTVVIPEAPCKTEKEAVQLLLVEMQKLLGFEDSAFAGKESVGTFLEATEFVEKVKEAHTCRVNWSTSLLEFKDMDSFDEVRTKIMDKYK